MIWQNDGDSNFSTTATITNSGTLLSGDLDGDMDVDILSTDGSLFLNDGQGNFTTDTQITASGGTFLRDLDGDNDLDLIVTTDTDRQIWFNVVPTSLANNNEPFFQSLRLPIFYREP